MFGILRNFGKFIVLALVAMPFPASAAWQQAKTRHFIIYADEPADRLAAFATKLEKFDKAVRIARAMEDPNVGDGNRLTVFVLSNDTAVRKLIGDKSGTIYGYYIARASGPVAFVPYSTDDSGDEGLHADTVFFHEYAHHLMMQALHRPLPRWLIEGFAEFLATAHFPSDGSVVLGAAAMHRSSALYDRDNNLTLEALFADKDGKLDAAQEDSLYGLGWLLVHFLTFEPSRLGQLEKYVNAIAAGTAPLAAAQAAFGDLRQLQTDVHSYLNRPRLKALVFPAEQVQPPAVAVSPLSPGASRAVLLRAQSRSGVNDKTATAVAAQARQVAAQFPVDELVQVELAEAELDAGNAVAAEAAASRAIALNPRNTDALVLKGEAIVKQALNDPARSAAKFDEARGIFISANKVDTEDPDPLFHFYLTFVEQRKALTANATAALHYASDLVPQDDTLRLNSAYIYLLDGKLAEARRALVPVAYDPHGGESADMAKAVIAKIDAGDSAGAIAAAEASNDKD